MSEAHAWQGFRKNLIDTIEVILQQESSNPNHREVAERIFDELHPKTIPA